MAKNWAIVVGINNYHNFKPLKYARRDAELVRNFFRQEVRFDEVLFFSDEQGEQKLKSGYAIRTQATYGNLISFLQNYFSKPFLSTGDNFWFFFAGHGEQNKGRDFLMPQDGNPGTEALAIPVSYVRERLYHSGADNVILILDACRTEGSRSSQGIGTEQQRGIITIYSCSPTQASWEIDELRQGAFTYGLLEALRKPGEQNCATVERLDKYLRYRVPDLCRRYRKWPEQTPHIAVEPIEKVHFILLSQHATSADVSSLKNDAYRAVQFHSNFDLAEQIWIRVLASTQYHDTEALQALQQIALRRAGHSPQLEHSVIAASDVGKNSRNDDTVKSSTPRVKSSRSTKSTSSISTSKDDSSSSQEVYCQKLQNLLETGRWKEADEETLKVMLKVTQREREGWLRVEDIRTFPCKELQAINQLWVQYSNGKFGFSVQKRIWQECGSPMESNSYWERFGNRVGWRKGKLFGMWFKEWIEFSEITFDTTAPTGHLPVQASWIKGKRRSDRWIVHLFSRIKACNI